MSEYEDRYPEHAKLMKVRDQVRAVHDFLDFAGEKGFQFGQTVVTRVAVFEGTEDCTAIQEVRGQRLEALVFEHFGIDRAEFLAEKERMIEDMAALNTPRS